MQTPGLPVSRPCVAAMNAAACSWRVMTSLIEDWRRLSTTSRFSSPGTPKMRSTPSFSSARTSRSDPLGIGSPLLLRVDVADDRLSEIPGGRAAAEIAGADVVLVQRRVDRRAHALGLLEAANVIEHQ